MGKEKGQTILMKRDEKVAVALHNIKFILHKCDTRKKC